MPQNGHGPVGQDGELLVGGRVHKEVPALGQEGLPQAHGLIHLLPADLLEEVIGEEGLELHPQ